MSPETPKPQANNPEMYVIPTAETDALDQARIDAQEFANTVNEQNRTFIDVSDVPKAAERVEVQHPEAERREIGHRAVAHAGDVVVINNPTPEQMRNAVGSPYYQDRLGRLTPKEEK